MRSGFILSCESTIDLPYSYCEQREIPAPFCFIPIRLTVSAMRTTYGTRSPSGFLWLLMPESCQAQRS